MAFGAFEARHRSGSIAIKRAVVTVRTLHVLGHCGGYPTVGRRWLGGAAAQQGRRVKRLGPGDVAALYQVREALEGMAARLCAERGDRAVLQELEALQEGLSTAAAGRDAAVYARLNAAFHGAIAVGSGNAILQDILARLQTPLMRRQFVGFLDGEIPDRSLADHDRLIDAIRAGDGGAAEETMRAHVRQSGAALAGAEGA